MLLHRHLQRKSDLLRRYFRQSSTAAAAVVSPFPIEPEAPLTYLPGFPKPDACETITAVPRSESGSRLSVRERKAGRIPSIVFQQKDGNLDENKRLISVQTKDIKKIISRLTPPFFLSRLFDLQVKSEFDSDDIIERVRVLPRLLHMNAATDAILNVTFMRAPSNALLKVDVPLVFRGEDASPGLRKGSYLNIIRKSVKFLCPADIVPPYIDVDLSELDVGQRVRMGDLKVHPALQLIESRNQSTDLPVVKIMKSRVSEQKKSK